jgi:hypothetical protein
MLTNAHKALAMLVGGSFLCLSAANAHRGRAALKPVHVASPLDVDAAIRNSQTAQDNSVAVRGYLRFGDDTHNILADKSTLLKVETQSIDDDDPIWRRCITLYDIGHWRTTLVSLDRHYVVIEGILRLRRRGPGELSLGSCSEWGISVRSVKMVR